MSVKIKYIKKTTHKSSSNLVLFCNEGFKTNNLKRYVSDKELSYINDILKKIDSKKNL